MVFVSCGDPSEEQIVNQLMEISVHNNTFTITNKEFSGNENCDIIFVSASMLSEVKKFRIEFELTKEGYIKDILLVDYSDNNRHYQSADFKPSETFFIENYTYDAIKKSLYFEFSGVLYDISSQSNTLPINGKIQFKNLSSVDCSFEPKSMKADVGNTVFSSVQTT
jgi:hypothetical protein